tara:strand:+ start:342 stop:668 length:327 start_codon:yes stop_codon:yes gene_type:complete
MTIERIYSNLPTPNVPQSPKPQSPRRTPSSKDPLRETSLNLKKKESSLPSSSYLALERQYQELCEDFARSHGWERLASLIARITGTELFSESAPSPEEIQTYLRILAL